MFHLEENLSKRMLNMLKSTFRNLFYILKFRASSIIIVLGIVILGFSFRSIDKLESTNPSLLSLEIPLVLNGEKLIQHAGYSFVYSEEHEQAKWIAYVLNNKEIDGIFDRSDNFREDPSVSSGSASNLDYAKSGYDRGHLAPAADMKWSEKAMSESFYYSNMSPQLPAFNRGIWKMLEEKMRDWALENDSILIVTGPILPSKNEKKLATIGPNSVTVPEYYYKAILDFKREKSKSIAFILPNKGSKMPLKSFVVTIDSLEKLSKIDFFYKLDDKIENNLESKICKECWTW
jgi:endonuclease G